MSSKYIIELAGVPGAGKSTACMILNERSNTKPLFLAKKYSCSRFKLLIGLPIIPFTILKFRRVFQNLIQRKSVHSKRLVLGRTILSILAELNVFLLEYWLANFEAAVRRKQIVLDGGYIQRGISVWLRTPPELQAELWSTYLSHIPRKTFCIVLDCKPAEALKRVQSRPEGIPNVIQSRSWSFPDKKWLLDQYQKMSQLLKSEEIRSRVKCSDIDADKKTDLIAAEIEAIIPLRNLVA